MSQAGETDDVQSPGLGTVCHVSQPDVLRDDAACIQVRVVPLGCNKYRPFRRLLVSTVQHTTWRLWDYGIIGRCLPEASYVYTLTFCFIDCAYS